VARDTQDSIYGKTAPFEITVYLGPIIGRQIMGTLFATIVIVLPIQRVYESVLSLTLHDTNLFVDKWLLISSYPYVVWQIGIVLQFEHIILMT